MLCRILVAAWNAALLATAVVNALDVNTTAIANQLVNLYPTTDPDLWWEGAQIYGALVDYSAQTGDQTYNALIAREIALQAGDTPPYFQPAIVQDSLTNFGQGRWALTAMLGEEIGFIRDPALVLDYLELARAVFDQIASRWDVATCGGGLNSTIYPTLQPSKDVFSVGEFFQLASRLAIKTRNGTYMTWAERIFDWATSIGVISPDWDVYASVDPVSNCTNVDKTRWSINAGELLYGTALMYNLTYAQSWVSRTIGVLSNINQTFFHDRIVHEPTCRLVDCTPGQRTYRGVLVKFMAKSAMAAPLITRDVQNILSQNGGAIAAMCADVVAEYSACTIAGRTGIGEQLMALNSVVSLLIGRGVDDEEQEVIDSEEPGAESCGTMVPSSMISVLLVALFMLLVDVF